MPDHPSCESCPGGAEIGRLPDLGDYHRTVSVWEGEVVLHTGDDSTASNLFLSPAEARELALLLTRATEELLREALRSLR